MDVKVYEAYGCAWCELADGRTFCAMTRKEIETELSKLGFGKVG